MGCAPAAPAPDFESSQRPVHRYNRLMTSDEDLVAGKAALARGDWSSARAALEQAIAVNPSGEAMEALGTACWWQDEGATVLEVREAAYRLYREEGDLRGAARVATLVGVDYWDYRGDFAVASGWMQRAETILKDLPPCPEHSWLHLYQGFGALMFANDPAEARKRIASLESLPPEAASVDVTMMAIALRGLTLIREGAVAEGMRMMDEAMTAAVGGDMTDLAAIGNTCCSLIYACEAVADYDRAAQWCERTREFCRRMGMDVIFAICRNYYATVLIWRGAWEEADVELSSALRTLQTNRPSYALESLAKLGELRRRQGRLEEAKSILAQAEPHRIAIFSQAAIALDAGETESAVDMLQRLLRRIGDEDQAERVFALELLARAHLRAGASQLAADLLPQMEEIAEQVRTAPLGATVKATRGAIALDAGELTEAKQCFEDAIDLFLASDAAFDAARIRLDYAATLERQGRTAAALHEAMLAQGTFAELGATLYGRHASETIARLSGSLGAPPVGQPLPYGLTAREAEVLWLIAAGKTNQDIARDLVLSVRTVERHISTVYEKLGLQGRAARAAAASIAVALRTNT